jgi:hypothetical protein
MKHKIIGKWTVINGLRLQYLEDITHPNRATFRFLARTEDMASDEPSHIIQVKGYTITAIEL